MNQTLQCLTALALLNVGCSGSVDEYGSQTTTTTSSTTTSSTTSTTSTSTSTSSGHATVGDVVPQPTTIELRINLSDGFMEPPEDDVYVIDVLQGTVTLNQQLSTQTTGLQMDELVAMVTATDYRPIDSCVDVAVDGIPFPPQLVVYDDSSYLSLQASDELCGCSDHSAEGKVLSCTDVAAIGEQVEEILPGGASPTCEYYCW